MKLAPYIACICEGSAEAAIIDVLVDNNLLIFTREDMLEESVIRYRSAKTFEERFLRKGFKDQISVIRILDSRREEFRLKAAEEAKKTEAEAVRKKLLASGMSADEILKKLK